ncbi:MAG: hypothetical protein ABL973_03970 [Micropepsaceae bacterium]
MPTPYPPGYPRTLRKGGVKLAAVYVGMPVPAVLVAKAGDNRDRVGVGPAG